MTTTLLALTFADVLGKNIEYKIGNETFVGYGARPKIAKANAPVVYVIQDWNGVDAHEEEVVEKLAHQGFAAFAIDIYGKGVRPKSVETCSAESGKYYKDPNLYMKRIQEGMKVMPTKGKKFLAGYCFGGSGVLEFARRNLGVTGVASFHGGLARLSKDPAKKISAKVLIMHGADDPFVSKEDLQACTNEMKAAAKSFKLVQYPGCVHAFTVKDMGFKVKGAEYNAKADNDSWVEFMKFLMANS